MSRGIAINAQQAADFLLLIQIIISANINVYHMSFDYYFTALLL
jgi:hypothetical protein